MREDLKAGLAAGTPSSVHTHWVQQLQQVIQARTVVSASTHLYIVNFSPGSLARVYWSDLGSTPRCLCKGTLCSLQTRGEGMKSSEQRAYKEQHSAAEPFVWPW